MFLWRKFQNSEKCLKEFYLIFVFHFNIFFLSFSFDILSYPFDWHKPIGYAACLLSLAAISFIIVYVYICTLSSTIGHCIHATGFISDIEANLHDFNEEFIETTHKSKSSRKQLEMHRKFNEIIEFYTNAREWDVMWFLLNQFYLNNFFYSQMVELWIFGELYGALRR